MNNISFSHYNLLRTCGQKFKLQVIDKLPTPGSHVFEFGSALHAGLNSVLETQELELSQDVFEGYWDSVSGKVSDYERHGPEQLKQMGVKFLATFFKKYAKDMKLVTGEKRLYAPWTEETTIEGTPDALVEWNGQNVLLDFKSSSYAYQDTKTDISLQLNLYAWLLEQNGYKVDAICYYVFNKSNGCIQTPYLVPYDKNKALSMIGNMVTFYIRNNGYYEKNASACSAYKVPCSYAELCWGKK
jgi:CRISPR/Cas system-associated exonuclease Cas4 (RecB family)